MDSIFVVVSSQLLRHQVDGRPVVGLYKPEGPLLAKGRKVEQGQGCWQPEKTELEDPKP